LKKFLFFLTLGLVLVLLAAPWLFGSFTEHRIEESLKRGADADPGIAIVTEAYRRHWFSSDSRHRLVITDARVARALQELTGSEAFGDQPALIVDTRIEHGPLPRTTDDEAPPAPGLSRAVSTFSLDPGSNAGPIPLPGRLVTTMALDGSTDALFTMEAGSWQPPDADAILSWQGARLEGGLSADGRSLRVSGRIRPLQLQGVAVSAGATPGSVRPQEKLPVFSVGAIDLVSEQRYTTYGIPVGSAAVDVDGFMLDDGTASIRAQGVRITSDSEIVDELLSGTTELRITGLYGKGTGIDRVAVDLGVSNLHAPSLQAIAETGRRLQVQQPPVSRAEWLRAVESDVARLVEAGPVLDLRDVVVELPEGEARLSSYVALAAGGDAGATVEPKDLIDRLTATLEVRVPGPLLSRAMETVPAFAEELEMLVAMGVLREDGDDYRLQAEFGNRLLTINGLPLPVPFGL
jgi:hypothetical protein